MTVGARLRQERERRGLAVEALAARTRIAVRILYAVERDDFGAIPSGIFVRGYLRAYARELELDPEEVIAAYRNEHEPVQPADTEAMVPAVAPPAPDPASRSARQSAALGIGLLVLLAAVSWWSRGGLVEEPSQTVTTQEGLEANHITDSVAERPTAPPPPSRPTPTASLQIEITAKSTVWVTATADGTRQVYRLLAPQEKVSLDARRNVTLRVGDAGALLVSVNGSTPAPAGQPGEVRNLDFAHDTATP